MGVLDVSLPDPSTLLEGAKEHGNSLGVLAGAVGAGVGASTVAGAPLATVIVPLLAQSYLEAAASDIFKKTDESLRKAGENRSGSMVRVCDGICQLIDPLIQDDLDTTESLEQAAREDPEKVQQVFEQLLMDDNRREELQQVEQTLAAMFAGEEPPDQAPIQSNDPEEIVSTLKEIFDAEDDREALYLYTLYSEFLGDFTSEVQETGAEDPELTEAIDSVEQRLGQVEQWTTEVVDTLTLLTLKNQAFTQLTALNFERQDPFRSKPPRYLWLTGFNFAELSARHGPTNEPYYFDRVPPDDCQLAAGKSEPTDSVSTAVVDKLLSDSNVVLTGPPGSGKSHICKRVAAEWYSDSHGDVFYRESAADKPFQQDAELERALKNADAESEGQTLVVVEDAVADHANRIFEVMDEFRRRPESDVCFLLDSRRSQWEAYAGDNQPQNDPPPYVRIAHDEGASDFLNVVEVPPITKQGCRNAIETFNRTTSGYYGPPEEMADRLYDAVIDEQSSQGELLVLSDELLTNSQYGADKQEFAGDAPLRSSAGDLHAQWLEAIDHGGDDPPLDYQIAIAVSTLTAADVDLSPSLLYALASDRREIKTVANILEGSADLPVEIRGTLLIPDEGAVNGFTTRHTQWGFEFLASQIEAGTAAADTVHETFVHTISTIAGLADDSQLRSDIAQWLSRNGQEAPFLERLEENPQQPIEDFLEAIVSTGRKQDGQLATLLQNSFLAGCLTDQENLPDVCSPVFRFELEIQRGWILRQVTAEGTFQDDPEQLFETIIDDAVAALTPPERDWIRARATAARAEIAKDRLRYPDAIERFETAIEHYESIDETYQAASTYRRLANLGRTAETLQWESVRERFERAIELFKEEEERYEVLRTATACASAAITKESIDWDAVLTLQERALELFEASEPNPDFAYWYRRTLREHSRVARESSTLEWEAVKTRYERAIDSYAEAGHYLIVARLQQELATAASEISALNWEEIQTLYEESIRTYRSNGLHQPIARVYQSLAKASHKYDATDWATSETYYEQALSHFREAGAEEKAIEVLREKADAASQVETFPWSSIESYYEDTIETCVNHDAQTDAAQTAQNLAEAAATTAPDIQIVDNRYQRAIERFESLGHSTEAARLAKRRAEVAAERDDVEWTDVERSYQAAIDRAERLGLDFEVVRIKRSLARAAKKQALDWSTIEQYYEQAAAAFEANDAPTKAAMTYRWLAEAAARAPDVGWETAQQHYDESTARFEANGNTFEVARNHRVLADTALETGTKSWKELEDHYTQAIEAYETAGHPDRIAKTYHKLGQTACETAGGSVDEADQYYQSALEQLQEVNRDETHQRIQVALDAAESFIEADAKARVVEWFDTAVKTWCETWTATAATATRDELTELRDLGARIADLLPTASDLAHTVTEEDSIERWYQQLTEAVSEDGPTDLRETLAASSQPTTGGNTHD